MYLAGRVHPDLESQSKKRLAVGNKVDRMPNFLLGHNNSLQEEVIYLETNDSTFCYMVHAFKLQLSQTCLHVEFCNVR